MPILYGLIRWSSDEQGSGSSLERQRASISAYAAELGARLVWLPTLDGVSARHGDNLRHPVMTRFRNDILNSKREVGILCVDEPTRFSRGDFWGTLEYLSPLMQRGMQFGIAGRKLLLRRDGQAGLFTLFGFLAESEGGYRENEKRVGQVKAEAALRRQKLGRGVVYSARMPDWLTCPPIIRKGQHERMIATIPDRVALAVEMM